MSNVVYPLFKQALLAGTAGRDLDNDTADDGPFCSLVTAGYTYDGAHDFYNDLTPASNVVGTDQRLTAPTVVNGTFDGSDVTYTAVTGSAVTQLIFYRHNTGANTTWPLFLKLDTGVTGLPVTPNGGNISITWNASGVFTISDVRSKDDISRLGTLGPLGLYSYRYKGDRRRQTGFMAHEVAEVIPQAVGRVEGYWGVDYGRVLRELDCL